MKRATVVLLGGVGLGVGAYLLLRNISGLHRPADLHLTANDLNYQNLSPADLLAEHLTDLNQASSLQLQELGLDELAIERLIENRPYRNKLELVSRMILPEPIYASIKDKVAVAKGRDPVKVA